MRKLPKSILSDQQRRVYDILIDTAERGDQCPTSVEMADRLRTSPSYIDSVFVALAHKRYIVLEGTVKGRIVKVAETGKSTARIDAMLHWSRRAANVEIIPTKPIEPGRYLLDEEGRLQPMRYKGFVRAVAVVTVRAKVIEVVINPVLKEPEMPVKAADTLEKTVVTKPGILPPVEPRTDPILRPMARKSKPTPVRVPKEELTDLDEDAEYTEFQRRLAAKRAERGAGKAEKPKIDLVRLANALRDRGVVRAPGESKKPTRYAQSPEPCVYCGIPGRRGCDHFLPYGEEVA